MPWALLKYRLHGRHPIERHFPPRSELARISGDAGLIRALEDRWSLDGARGCHFAPRRDSQFWFALTGTHASAMFARIHGRPIGLEALQGAARHG